MAEQRDWLNVAEIAELTGKTKDYVRRVMCASVRPDQQQQRLSVGRGRPTTEYHVSVLPPDVRLVVRPDAAPLPALLPPKRQQCPEELKDWQQKRWTARIGVVREVHKLEAGGVSRHEAIKIFLRYFNGGLMPELLPASRTGTLRVVRVYGLCALYDSGGELALMPADRSLPKLRKDEWLPYFLRIWRNRDTGKNGRSIMDTFREMEATLPKNVPCPTYQTVRDYLAKMSSVERNKGRLTENDLKAPRICHSERQKMKITKTVLNRQEIEVRVAALGRQITADYQGKKLVLLGVLNGAFIFLADLARAIELEVEIDFIRAASYGDATANSGSVVLHNEPDIDLAGKDILIVEDIVDSGLTIAHLREHFMNKYQIASVKVCALLDKRERRSVAAQVDYAGFILISGFLVGYGLDSAQKWRNLPEICEAAS